MIHQPGFGICTILNRILPAWPRGKFTIFSNPPWIDLLVKEREADWYNRENRITRDDETLNVRCVAHPPQVIRHPPAENADEDYSCYPPIQ